MYSIQAMALYNSRLWFHSPPRSVFNVFPHQRNSRKLRVLPHRKGSHCFFYHPTATTTTAASTTTTTSTTNFHRRFFETKNNANDNENQRRNNNNNNKINDRKGNTVVTFLTDVEGDAAYLDRYVELSRILRFVLNEPRLLLVPKSSSSSSSSWNHLDHHTNNHNSFDSSSFEVQDDFYSCRYFPYDKCIDFCDDDDDEQDDVQDDHDTEPTTTTTNNMLIYGGDVWDKGGSDLYVIRQLLDLKRRYPDRVYFIAGNRDINKMRISQEMGVYNSNSNNREEANSNTPQNAHQVTPTTTTTTTTPTTTPKLPKHNGVYWLRNWSIRQGKDPNKDESILPPQTNEVERLKWILARTMGSPKAFELRRKELEREKQTNRIVDDQQHPSSSEDDNDDTVISDEDVVESYRRSCHPSTGEIGNYLSNANLAFRLGELLVLHGALPLTDPVLDKAIQEEQDPTDFWKDLSFAKPWEEERINDDNDKENNNNNNKEQEATNKSTSTTATEAIDEWIESINQFAMTSVDCWKDSIHNWNSNNQQPWALEGGYLVDSPAGQLMQYGMGWTPDGKRNPTIVYQSWSLDGMPRRFYPNTDSKDVKDQMFARLVEEFFRQSKVRLILAGHQPQGDLPLPIRVDDNDTCNQGGDHENKTLGWVLCCDTSYSGDTYWFDKHCNAVERVNKGRGKGPGFRGDVAVSEVLVELNAAKRIQTVRWHGVLSDGTKYESQHLPLSSNPSTKVKVGSLAEGDWVPSKEDAPQHCHWWTKADIGNASVLASGKGFDITNYFFRHSGV